MTSSRRAFQFMVHSFILLELGARGDKGAQTTTSAYRYPQSLPTYIITYHSYHTLGKMSWLFGGGNNSDDKNKSLTVAGSDDSLMPRDTSPFDQGTTDFSDSSSISSGFSGGARMGSFEQELMLEQQKALIQQVLFL